jgi:hypothetical protein
VDLRFNGYTAIAVPPAAFWPAYRVVPSVDLSFNAITTPPAGALQQAIFAGDLLLQNNSLGALPSYTFSALTVGGHLNLSGNANMDSVNVYSLYACTINGTLDLSRNGIRIVEVNAFQQMRVGGDFDLRANALAAILSGAFYSVAVGGGILLAGNPLAELQPNAFLNTQAQVVDLANMPITSIAPYVFALLLASPQQRDRELTSARCWVCVQVRVQPRQHQQPDADGAAADDAAELQLLVADVRHVCVLVHAARRHHPEQRVPGLAVWRARPAQPRRHRRRRAGL